VRMTDQLERERERPSGDHVEGRGAVRVGGVGGGSELGAPSRQPVGRYPLRGEVEAPHESNTLSSQYTRAEIGPFAPSGFRLDTTAGGGGRSGSSSGFAGAGDRRPSPARWTLASSPAGRASGSGFPVTG